MSESEKKQEKIPILINPNVAAAGFLRKYSEATTEDVANLAKLFMWFEQQGRVTKT